MSRKSTTLYRYLFLTVIVLLTIPICASANGDDNPRGNRILDGWYLCVFSGQASGNYLRELLFLNINSKKAYMSALGIGKELWTNHENIAVEIEFQIAKHWSKKYLEDNDPASGDPGWSWAEGFSHDIIDTGHHSHEEYNVAFNLRWFNFPWNRYLPTTFAIGEGFSYATEDPPIEIRMHSLYHYGEYEKVSRFLNYLLFEITLGLPRCPQFSVFYRITAPASAG